VPGAADDAPDLLDEGLRRSLCDAVADAADVIGSSAAIPYLTGELVRQVIAADDGHARGRGDDRQRVKLLLGAHAKAGPPHARALRVVAGSNGASLLACGEHRKAAAEVAEAAIARGHAVPAPVGEIPVVLGPGSPASLFHEVCGHGLEGDIASSPGAAYGPLIGKTVAGPALTIADDPRAPELAPLYRRDDEGEAARETVLVDHGVVASVLADRTTARLLRLPATGSGRRVGYQHPALTRMSCTYVKPGDAPPEAALDGIRRGLYVAAIVSGETNMSGESFEARATEAYLIENGALTRPVTGAVLTGRGLDLLRAVDVVCDDLRFLAYGFLCNKLGQFPLAVSVGQPTLRIRQLAVHA
jgi:TldD protein